MSQFSETNTVRMCLYTVCVVFHSSLVVLVISDKVRLSTMEGKCDFTEKSVYVDCMTENKLRVKSESEGNTNTNRT